MRNDGISSIHASKSGWSGPDGWAGGVEKTVSKVESVDCAVRRPLTVSESWIRSLSHYKLHAGERSHRSSQWGGDRSSGGWTIDCTEPGAGGPGRAMWTVMRDFRERKSTKAAEDKPAGALTKDLHKSQLGWVEEYWTGCGRQESTPKFCRDALNRKATKKKKRGQPLGLCNGQRFQQSGSVGGLSSNFPLSTSEQAP